MKKVVGIIGGMGPLATVDLMTKIISHTAAKNDQDHIHIIADNDTQIPDRTSAIMGKGEDPAPYMVQSALRLQNAGADFLVIACNTAHFFYDTVQNAVRIPILHMPLETADFLQEHGFKKVGLLATNGTIKTKLYQRYCQSCGIEVLEPEEEIQKTVMEGIYSIKRGDLATGASLLLTAADKLLTEGAEAVIAGCTEIPLVLASSPHLCVIDPTEILAEAVIKTAATTTSELQLV
ncbi:aspartate/glutamate racemase family protein [Mesobacillus zeae]|uniref:Amino acid racemase n=1 Tax=Mesobacillus zeae TaxID=1917180 RepID=A0A398B649_9BACI|nr:amino acid racemase [Mesobacillus zeae]RID85569.1 amino acid racemase [Mesobacillus zeae]